MKKNEKIQILCKLLHGKIHFIDSDNKERAEIGLKLKAYVITRYELKKLISHALNITDGHTVNGWITLLLGKVIIRPNPTSELSAKKRKLKPTNDTRYFINECRVNEYAFPETTHTLSKNKNQTTLRKFLHKESLNSEGKHSLNVSSDKMDSNLVEGSRGKNNKHI